MGHFRPTKALARSMARSRRGNELELDGASHATLEGKAIPAKLLVSGAGNLKTPGLVFQSRAQVKLSAPATPQSMREAISFMMSSTGSSLKFLGNPPKVVGTKSGVRRSHVLAEDGQRRVMTHSLAMIQLPAWTLGLLPLAAPLKPKGAGLNSPTRLTSLSSVILSSSPTVQSTALTSIRRTQGLFRFRSRLPWWS